MYVFVSLMRYIQHSDNIQFIEVRHTHTVMKIHAHPTKFESHSYMHECNSNMTECGMNVYVSFATFSKINQFVCCMNVVKGTYTFKHGGSLMERVDPRAFHPPTNQSALATPGGMPRRTV